jgi:hypothetical protein
LSLFPPLAMLEVLAGLWGLYLFYAGIPIVMRTSRDKALPYTALCVVCAFVIGFVLSLVLGTLFAAGRIAAGGFGNPASGIASQTQDDAGAKGVAAAVIGSAMGGGDSDKKAAAAMIDSVAQAGRAADAAADAAAASGDSTAQAQAGVNVLKSFVTAGKTAVTPIPREALKTLLPDAVASLPRAAADSRTGTFAGITASSATATYGDEKSGTLELNVGDLGNMGGLALLANVGANLASTESDEGYTKTIDVAGRKVHEQWTAAGKKSQLFEIIDNRYAVSVDGSGVDMDVALQALESVDTAKFAQLKP